MSTISSKVVGFIYAKNASIELPASSKHLGLHNY